MNFVNHFFRMTGDNHGLHPLLLGKDRIRHTAGYKDGNHRVESVFPTEGQTSDQHNNAIYNQGDTANVAASFLADSQTDNIRPPTRNA